MGRPHFKSSGKLLMADKKWGDLSDKQKNWITELIYNELKTNQDKTKHSKNIKAYNNVLFIKDIRQLSS